MNTQPDRATIDEQIADAEARLAASRARREETRSAAAARAREWDELAARQPVHQQTRGTHRRMMSRP